MPDALEERLAARLRTLGDLVDDELAPPADLELQVQRTRRRTRSARRWSSLAIAAAIVVVASTAAVVHGTTGRGTIRIATSPTTSVSARDPLQPGSVMLASRGIFVVSLDGRGVQNATMVKATLGDILYAHATDDHRFIWYLSLKKGLNACGDVVREDVDAGTTEIVTHAEAFDVSPDGTRLALYGAGDLAHDKCSPVKRASDGRIAVVDPATSASSTVKMADVTSLRWSPDSEYVVGVSCPANGCRVFRTHDVPHDLGAPLVIAPRDPSSYQADTIRSASVVFGSDGLYMLEATSPVGHSSPTTKRVDRIDPRAADSVVTVFSSDKWNVAQVVPTASATYVIAAPLKKAAIATKPDWGLYRVVKGKLVLVRPAQGTWTLTPVTPLSAG